MPLPRTRRKWVWGVAVLCLGGERRETGPNGGAKKTKVTMSFLIFRVGFCSKRKGLKSRYC